MSLNKKVVWLPYDMDTAIGINNDGELVFDYQLEDIDYQRSGAPIFNGQDSVIWKNIRAAFGDELKTMYQNLRSSGAISYDKVERMFEEHQSKWCEAIFNEDAHFKYIEPFVRDNANYLYMLLGSKEEQRKWWLYNRFRYIDSKYIAGDARSDSIFLRPYAPADITVTPYADIYATIAWDATITQERAERNNPITLECPYQAMNGNIVTIYSSSQLALIGDLSPLQIGQIDISNATRLQALKVGSSASGYDNSNLYSLTFGNNILLKSIDVRNCSGLGDTSLQGHTQTTVDISGCGIVEEVYFDGTKIQGVSLPNGGVLRVLHLPSTITNLTILNQKNITDLSVGSYSNISTLRLENVPTIDTMAILNSIPTGSRVRLIGFSWEAQDAEEIEDLLDLLDSMRGLDENGNNMERAQVSGTIHTESLTGSQIASYNTRYPYLTITADHTTSILTYMTYNGSSVITTETIYDGSDGTVVNTTARAADSHYTYTPNGWSRVPNGSPDATALVNIIADRTVYAAYNAEGQKYTVTFYNRTIYGDTVLQTVRNVLYGGTAYYPGETPVNDEDPDMFEFIGWSPSNTNITGNTSCYAQYRDLRTDLTKYISGTLVDYTSDSNSKISSHAFHSYDTLRTVVAPITEVESYAFYNQAGLLSADFTSELPVTFRQSCMNIKSLQHVVLRGTTLSTLASTTAFSSSKIRNGFGGIYVPSELLSAYKSASNWSSYADNIYPIESYPLNDFSSITDSWDEIFAAIDNGTYSSRYKIGDTKTINVNGYNLYAQIVAFDTDILEDSESTAPITFVIKTFAWKDQINDTSSTDGGWGECSLRTKLNNEIFSTIDDYIASRIKSVEKTYFDPTTESTKVSIDKLWLLSSMEMLGGQSTYTIEDSGVTYNSFFNQSTGGVRNKIRFDLISGESGTVLLRTPVLTTDGTYAGTYTSYRAVTSSNSYTAYAPTSAINVVFGFCVG